MTKTKPRTKTEASKDALRERERALVHELQIDHGYRFLEIKRADDRYGTIFHGFSRDRKALLTPVRHLHAAVPKNSWLARTAEGDLKAKTKTKAKTKSADEAMTAKATAATGAARRIAIKVKDATKTKARTRR